MFRERLTMQILHRNHGMIPTGCDKYGKFYRTVLNVINIYDFEINLFVSPYNL